MVTKKEIDSLAKEIMDYLLQKDLAEGVFIYFNGKRMHSGYSHDGPSGRTVGSGIVTEDGFCPLDYFEYANHRHILSMSFEGPFYHSMNYNGYGMDGFNSILARFGLYYEMGNAWNLSLFPADDDMYSQIEYTDYTDRSRPDPVHIYDPNRQPEIPPALQEIMRKWYQLSSGTGDRGSCVIGAGFTFSYGGTEYHMSPQSPYQGSLSWETHVETVKDMLEKAGATDIRYNYGVLD